MPQLKSESLGTGLIVYGTVVLARPAHRYGYRLTGPRAGNQRYVKPKRYGAMDKTEAFIKDAASRGWSRTEVCEVLGISWNSLMAMLQLMPGITWVPGSQSLCRKNSNEQRRGIFTPKLKAAQQIAIAKRREKTTHEVNGTRGTIKELAQLSAVSASTVRRRMSMGESLESALSRPPTPPNQRRKS